MAAATVITYSKAIPSDTAGARSLSGPLVPTLVKLWRDTYASLPKTYFLLVQEADAEDLGHTGPVVRLTPPVFAKGTGAVAIACTMTDDPEAEHSRHCVWKLGGGAEPTSS